jgi:aspartyl-tRNA(Asn)/glutamyl-tRNA(Gln) amidotransferase subunit C
MSIDKKTIEHVAKLAHLELSPAEVEKYTDELSKILNYADEIKAAATDSVEASANPFNSGNVLREDVVFPFENLAGLLANGPKTSDTFYEVPKIRD